MSRRIISKVQYPTVSDAVDQPLINNNVVLSGGGLEISMDMTLINWKMIPNSWEAKSAQKSVASTNKPRSSSGIIVQIPIPDNIIKLNFIQQFNLIKNLQ